MKKITYAIALLALAVGVFAGWQHHKPQPAASNAVARLFQQTLPDAAGQAQALAQFKQRPLIVNFWASWCAPCVEEMPALSALQTRLAKRNVQIVGIGIDSAEPVQQFARQHRIGFPLYVAGVAGSELMREFGNRSGGLPFTVIISARGDILHTYLGRIDFSDLEARVAQL